MIIKNLEKNFLTNLFLVFLIFLFDRLSKIYVIFIDNKFSGSEILVILEFKNISTTSFVFVILLT